MSDPVRIGGFFSTFDYESVIQQLTDVRMVKVRRLEVERAKADARKETLADVSSKFSSLLSKVNTLVNTTSVSGKSATVTGSGVLATAPATASIGSFTVDVVKLASGTVAQGSAISAAVAQATVLDSANLATRVTSGNFSINGTTIAVDTTVDTLDDVVARINANVAGVTATIENDANGRANILRLTSGASIAVGSGADTSNFLVATNLLASPGTTTRESTLSLARLSPAEKMANTSWFGGAPAGGAHTFTLNGVSISYDTANDSLNDVINRINGSAAGVVARYDSLTDTVKLTQTKLGSFAITLADDGAGGDFLAKTGLLAATQTMGGNAEYKIDGGASQYSASNSVTTPNGVGLTLTATTQVGTPVTVSVTQDSAGAVNAIKAFVAEFNSALAAIDTATKADGLKENSQSGVLSGDASLRNLKARLRSLVTGTGTSVPGNFDNLGQVGLSFGKVGSKYGSTNTLAFDEAKFKAALESDPTSVQALFSTVGFSSTLEPAGTSSLASLSGTYTGDRAGQYQVNDDGAGNLSFIFTPANGGTPTTTTATVVANGTNTTAIPGLTLQIGPALQAGTSYITVTRTSASVFRDIKDFLEMQAGSGGALQSRQDAFNNIIRDVEKRKDTVLSHIDAEMDNLRKKFIAMEQAQARAASIISSLQQSMAKMSAQ